MTYAVMTYLGLGIWTYCCIAAARYDYFKGSNTASIIRGLLIAVFCWPIAPILCVLLK
jgi:hypothetical protein